MAYSKDFRQKVLSIREERGPSLLETAKLMDVGVASLFRWTKKTGPCKTRNKPATKIDMEALARDVEEKPDDFQYERAIRLGVSESCVGRALKRLKVSRKKKSLVHPKACEETRKIFQDKMENYEKEGKNIVHLDESGFEKETLRDYGYATIGTRCVGLFDWQAKGRTNVIGAIFCGMLIGAGLFEFNVNANVFHGWVVQCLLPALPSDSVVVMDNASFHKRQDIQAAITQAGHMVEYLPPYSPDLNPIEKKWAQAKAIRRQKRCSVDELFKQCF